MRNKTDDLEQRADLISAAIATISSQIKLLEATGVVAPPDDVVSCVIKHGEKNKLIGTTSYKPLSQFFPPHRER
jgi:hypothetical protein